MEYSPIVMKTSIQQPPPPPPPPHHHPHSCSIYLLKCSKTIKQGSQLLACNEMETRYESIHVIWYKHNRTTDNQRTVSKCTNKT